jgi:predicted nucleic acid-binding Zn ribbon protein
MPTYEYRCDVGHEFEAVQGIKDDRLDACEFVICINGKELEGKEGYGKEGKFMKCGAPVIRLIAGCTFVLKGSGWTPKGGS